LVNGSENENIATPMSAHTSPCRCREPTAVQTGIGAPAITIHSYMRGWRAGAVTYPSSVHFRSRGLLLVPAAAIVVHQARYTLGYGMHANSELAAQGHSYLHSVVPWTILALGLAATSFLRRLAHAARTGEARSGRARSFLALWGTTSGGLLAIYCVQETLEGFVVSGHPGGVGGVFGHGGWWAVPVSAIVALAVAALLRMGGAAIRYAARLAPRASRAAGTRRFPPSVALLPPPVLARAAAGRAPPLAR
jgi:hypothetical protein